ncbi:MAG TPA: hypothetical protein VIQ27_05515 [Gemmatimonadales bacterium]
MRRARRHLFLLIAALGAPAIGEARAQRLPDPDRTRLAEAFRVARRTRADVWPGWERTPMAVLLVGDSVEYLVGHPRPTSEFTPLGVDSVLALEVLVRPRRFPPALLATFPAVGGMPTIVVGSAERTGKSSAEWVLTLLHEHFHQWQSSLPDYYARADGLGLARGDTTGQWMLDYPFPYDSTPVQRAAKALATSLGRGESLEGVALQRQALRRTLSAADDRYLEFQLWQEGVPRWVEIAVAEAAARSGEPAEPFRRLPDYEGYARLAQRLRRRLGTELAALDLGRDRRVAFYPIGAGIAALLERSEAGWRERYQHRLFSLMSP